MIKKTLCVLAFSTCFLILFDSCQNKSSLLNPGLASFTLSTFQTFSQWGSAGSGNGQFSFPEGIAVDFSGNVYVADSFNNRVQKFDSNGVYLRQWGNLGSSNGQFSHPAGVAVDLSGNVYVVDRVNNRVQKFDSNGNYLTQWGSSAPNSGSGNDQFSNPEGLCVDSSGNVYVADSLNSRVQKFDSNGNYLAQWGSLGTGGSDQFGGPEGLAVDSSGNIYVGDFSRDRVQKFDSNRNYLTQWGSSAPTTGSGNGQFYLPEGVAVDLFGSVYVADTFNNRLQKFDSNGNYIIQIGSSAPITGSGNGQFNHPWGVATDGLGNLYVTDTSNNRIEKFSYSPAFNGLKPDAITVYPNPVHIGQNLNFAFRLRTSGFFSITIKDEAGNEAAEYQGLATTGNNLLQWNGVPTTNGYSLSYGSYYAVFNAESSATTIGFSYAP